MLINTVLVFLQNILPIFVMFSLLIAQHSANSRSSIQFGEQVSRLKNNKSSQIPVTKLIQTIGVGFIIVCLLNYYMAQISQLNAGSGLEFIFSIIFSLIYCFIILTFLISSVSNHKQWQYKTLSEQQMLMQPQIFINLLTLLLVFCVHGSYFSLYVMSFIVSSSPMETSYSGIILGMIIGAGICLSIAILLYFILVTLDKKLKGKVISYFLLFFGVGQLMQGLQLLEQVDLISSTVHLWSTSYLIAEDSELGYFLTILFGYEATPSAMEISVYLSAIMVPLLLARFITYRQNTTATLFKGTD